ncbi:MAG: hypothetical protein K9N34_05235, partial [Candidatus Marinimicrobia bacterium]|nr:hypothetical protein [Candidatus Neomarinimicrobiota bacterium]
LTVVVWSVLGSTIMAQPVLYPPNFENNDFYKLHVLFTNDLHGAIDMSKAWFMNPEYPPDLGGGASMYTYVQNIRQEAEAEGAGVLLLDAGNFYQGTPLGISDSGRTILNWMNAMQYDAGALGTYEFMFGVENVRQLAKTANFPFLSGNIVYKNSGSPVEFAEPGGIYSFDGIQVGLFGLTTSGTPDLLAPEKTRGLQFRNSLEVTEELVTGLRDRGATVILSLAHLGVPYGRERAFDEFMESTIEEDFNTAPVNSLQLAHLIPGIDAVFSGHITAGYNHPWEDPDTHTLVFQGYGNGSNIGHVTLYIHKQTKALSGYSLPTKRGGLVTLSTDDVVPNEQIARQYGKLAEQANQATWEVPDYQKKLETIRNIRPLSFAALDTIPGRPLQDKFPIPRFNRWDALEAMTWNMEHFPKEADLTISTASEVLHEIGADIYAVQEIGNITAFMDLMASLPQYGYVLTQQSSFYDQAILYRKDVLTPLMAAEPFAEMDYNFAGRPPLRADFIWRFGEKEMVVTIVNIHMKCCGDGVNRRKKAAVELHTYLNHLVDNGLENIIVLGDWNDDVTDTGQEQSFPVFLEDGENYRFATMQIAHDPDQASYPTWPSFLDHILISKALFQSFDNGGVIRTLPIETWFGSWKNYEYLVSDHRPVLLRIPVE